MRIHQIILPLLASSMLFVGCDDQKMEWGTPDGHNPVVSSEIPLALREKIANYDYIKSYMAKYMPNVPLGVGLGADKYLSDSAYASICDLNFQQFVTGNAMKHASVVKNDGSLDLTTINQFLTKAVPTGAQIYGHNFIWHTQQNQTYLKSLISPTMKVESDGDVANILTNGDFESGSKSPWGSWGNGSTTDVAAGVGYNGTYGVKLVNPKDASEYSAQFAYTLNEPLVVGKKYVIKFKAKSTSSAGVLQFSAQNSNTYAGEGYNNFSVGTDWTDCEYEYTCTKDGMNRILINFGKVAATYIVDNIEFGLKIEDPMDNVMTGDNSDFEGGTKGSWGSWGNSSTTSVASGVGFNNTYGAVLVNPKDASEYSAQFAYTFADPLVVGKTYIIQFKAKASTASGVLQFATQNSSTYAGEGYHNFSVGTDWITCESEYTCSKDGMDRILINFGKVAGTYYVDNIKFGVKKTAASARRRATKVTYTYKTADEKRTALLGAMESWIKGMMTNFGTTIKQWDVINEPITDGTYQWRGVDGNFMNDDTAPVEKDGLTLNWADGHFYWGYYIGKEYAVKAFEYAHKYGPSDCKLYVNDYNLETSPKKLAALIEFVNYIEQQGQKVDGIGTQMHVSSSITKDQVDAMFKTLAATGKLVRISELDVQVGTATPSTEQYQAQSDTYQMIIESYKANVPDAQRGGITIWGVSDAKEEHTYWLPDDAPNLFDASYARKIAYKGVCDGIAGKDISTEFTGDMWPKAYQ